MSSAARRDGLFHCAHTEAEWDRSTPTRYRRPQRMNANAGVARMAIRRRVPCSSGARTNGNGGHGRRGSVTPAEPQRTTELCARYVWSWTLGAFRTRERVVPDHLGEGFSDRKSTRLNSSHLVIS